MSNAKKRMVPSLPRGGPMNQVDRALIYGSMIQRGILPIDNPQLDMRVALRGLPPDEARSKRRKFRKLWRKLARASDKTGAALGLGKVQPSRSDKLERKRYVLERTWVEDVVPAVAALGENTRSKLC